MDIVFSQFQYSVHMEFQYSVHMEFPLFSLNCREDRVFSPGYVHETCVIFVEWVGGACLNSVDSYEGLLIVIDVHMSNSIMVVPTLSFPPFVYLFVCLFVCLCSAGVGRTGTFICIDGILEQIKKESVVDIAGTITRIRHQRMKMVQTPVSQCPSPLLVTSNKMASHSLAQIRDIVGLGTQIRDIVGLGTQIRDIVGLGTYVGLDNVTRGGYIF